MTSAAKHTALDPDTSNSDDGPVVLKCPFLGCGKVRIHEGGRPFIPPHRDTCTVCHSRVVVPLADRALVAALVNQDLL